MRSGSNSLRNTSSHLNISGGHAYNTFPKMGDSWIPDDIFELKPLIRNFFENTSTVQKVGHPSGYSIFGWKHIWNGCSSGNLRCINTSIICTCFTWHCTSGRSLNRFDTHAPAQSHCKKAFHVPSENAASGCKDSLIAIESPEDIR